MPLQADAETRISSLAHNCNNDETLRALTQVGGDRVHGGSLDGGGGDCGDDADDVGGDDGWTCRACANGVADVCFDRIYQAWTAPDPRNPFRHQKPRERDRLTLS